MAIAGGGTNRVMTSPDGITWTARSATAVVSWQAIAYGNGTFAAVSWGSTDVMTSGRSEFNAIATNNIYQGGMSIYGDVGIGTAVPSSSLHVVGTFQATATSTFDGNIIMSNLSNQIYCLSRIN